MYASTPRDWKQPQLNAVLFWNHVYLFSYFFLKVVRNSFPFSVTTEIYSFIVKDYYYFLIADVAITFQLINSCNHWHFGCHGNLTGPQINAISSIQLHFTQKVVSKLPFVLHQNCLHIKEHFLRKFKKILSRGFVATLIFCNIDVQTILMQ